MERSVFVQLWSRRSTTLLQVLPLLAVAFLGAGTTIAQVDSGSCCALATPCAPCAADEFADCCLGNVTYSVTTVVPLPPDGKLHYESLTVDADVTLSFEKNEVNTPVFILSSGNATINGTINVSAPDPGQPGGAAPTGSAGDGNVGDDGIPGVGGPGGFAGGVGGLGGSYGGSLRQPGGSGLGPGGGGAGGSAYQQSSSQCYWVGASGGFGTSGSTWNTSSPVGGEAYGLPRLLPLIGGSGGGGGAGGATYNGSGGGGGGGAVLVSSTGAINVTGSILADGGDYADADGSGLGYRSGAGSGGAIRLVADTVSVSGSLYARGGAVYCSTAGTGRIRVDSNVQGLDGNISPTATIGDPTDETTFFPFLPDEPTLRIASVGGQDVLTTTGAGDVVFPDGQPPVDIVVEASQIPLGTNVQLTVKDPIGTVTEYDSSALDGTLEASSATVTGVTLPSGPSVLEAQATFTLVLPQGGGGSASAAPLMHGDEPIELAEVRVGSDGRSEVFYLTSSKKRIPESEIGPLAYALRP